MKRLNLNFELKKKKGKGKGGGRKQKKGIINGRCNCGNKERKEKMFWEKRTS